MFTTVSIHPPKPVRHLLVFLFALNPMLSLAIFVCDVMRGVDQVDERYSGGDRHEDEGKTGGQSLWVFSILVVGVRSYFSPCFDAKSMLGFGEFV